MLPQSNQRGIETSDAEDPRVRDWKPQSNQRGIETRAGDVMALARPGLNRTSVGLKPAIDACYGYYCYYASIEPAWD